MLIFKFLTEILVLEELGISIITRGKANLIVYTLLGLYLHVTHHESDVRAMCHPTRTSSVGRQTPCGPRYILQRAKFTNTWKM